MIDLDELERLHAAATPGPWYDDADDPASIAADYAEVFIEDENFGSVNIADQFDCTDAQFVVALRNAFPGMRRELRARRRQAEAIDLPVRAAALFAQLNGNEQLYRALLDAIEAKAEEEGKS